MTRPWRARRRRTRGTTTPATRSSTRPSPRSPPPSRSMPRRARLPHRAALPGAGARRVAAMELGRGAAARAGSGSRCPRCRTRCCSLPQTRVLVANGRYDLVTPYFASRWLLDQLAAAGIGARRIELRVYDGGHMMYMRPQVAGGARRRCGAGVRRHGPAPPQPRAVAAPPRADRGARAGPAAAIARGPPVARRVRPSGERVHERDFVPICGLPAVKALLRAIRAASSGCFSSRVLPRAGRPAALWRSAQALPRGRGRRAGADRRHGAPWRRRRGRAAAPAAAVRSEMGRRLGAREPAAADPRRHRQPAQSRRDRAQRRLFRHRAWSSPTGPIRPCRPRPAIASPRVGSNLLLYRASLPAALGALPGAAFAWSGRARPRDPAGRSAPRRAGRAGARQRERGVEPATWRCATHRDDPRRGSRSGRRAVAECRRRRRDPALRPDLAIGSRGRPLTKGEDKQTFSRT